MTLEHKLIIGIPAWGTQSADFWQPAMMEASRLYKYGIDLLDVAVARSMSTDNNRNEIVDQFLQSKADWLAWLDTDNSQQLTWIPRLLEGKKEASGGIYFRRDPDRPTPIAYLRQPDGRYQTIPGYIRGNIIPVDAGGMNATLFHRSVFEEIQKNYELFITDWGAKWIVHIDDIQGHVMDDDQDVTDNQLIDGQLRIRLRKIPHNPDGKDTFPFFRQEFNRTEDMPFFEALQRVGFQHWIDTSIECKHYTDVGIDGSHYREWIANQIKEGKWKE